MVQLHSIIFVMHIVSSSPCNLGLSHQREGNKEAAQGKRNLKKGNKIKHLHFVVTAPLTVYHFVTQMSNKYIVFMKTVLFRPTFNEI